MQGFGIDFERTVFTAYDVANILYRVGSLREFAEWTKSVVRDPRSADRVPKKWFNCEETAARAATDQVSAETMVKLLSPGNLAVLEAIRRHKPASMRELATLTRRKEASLSRTLNWLAWQERRLVLP